MEAGVSHAEIILNELVHDQRRSVVAPGIDYGEVVDEYPELSAEYAQAFRRWVARPNYIGIDRPDIAFAVKELCQAPVPGKEFSKQHFG